MNTCENTHTSLSFFLFQNTQSHIKTNKQTSQMRPARTCSLHIVDWHNTSATRYKQIRTMLRPESSAVTKMRAFESLLTGVNVYKRTFSGRVAIPLDTSSDDVEVGPASLFPLVLDAVRGAEPRVRTLALSWLTHISATPHLDHAFTLHAELIPLLLQRLDHSLPADPTDTSLEHNRDWILCSAVLFHLLHPLHSGRSVLLLFLFFFSSFLSAAPASRFSPLASALIDVMIGVHRGTSSSTVVGSHDYHSPSSHRTATE